MALGDLSRKFTDFRLSGGITSFLFGDENPVPNQQIARPPSGVPTDQGDGKGNGKPYTLNMFDLNKGPDEIIRSYQFLVNPETVSYDFPSRSTVVQTLGGAVVDHFGLGIPTITISGTTGWNSRGGADGFLAFKSLFEFYKIYHSVLLSDKGQKERIRVEFNDGPSDITYQVHLQDLKIPRTKARPLLFPFSLVMRVLNIEDDIPTELTTFDPYAAFFTGKNFRSLLSARTQELKERLTSLETNVGVLPAGFKDILAAGNDALETVDNLISIGEDAIGLIQDTANFITNNLSRVARTVQGVARTLQDFSTLPSNIATNFIGSINEIIQAYGDIECVLMDFNKSRALRPRIRLITGGTVCATIIGADAPTINALQGNNTFEELSSAGVPVEILDSVKLTTAAEDSLALLESVDPVLEDFGGINPLKELNTIIEGLVVNTETDYVVAMAEADLDIADMDVITDTNTQSIIQGDSLQSISFNVLGDSTRWEEIALLNNLRYPFISEEFIHTLAPKMADLIILSGAGDTYLFLDIEGASVDQQVYFTDGTLEEFRTIISVDDSTGQIVFDSATSVDFTSLAKVSLHENPEESSTQVLKIGDFITVPRDSAIPNSVNSDDTEDSTDFNRIFGIDIRVDEEGFMTLGETGDLVLTEDGVENIGQALRIRLNTGNNELRHHNDYGVGLPEKIGRIASVGLANQISNSIRFGIPRDPRIVRARNIQTAIDGDQIGVKFDAETSDRLTLTNVNFIATR